MTSMFKAVEEIDLLSLFQMTDQQPSKVDAQIVQALISDGAFVATGLAGSSSLDGKVSNLIISLPIQTFTEGTTRFLKHLIGLIKKVLTSDRNLP